MKNDLLIGTESFSRLCYWPKDDFQLPLALRVLSSHDRGVDGGSIGQMALYLTAAAAAAAAKSLQSCPTLCDPIDGSPRGSPIPGILQARTLEWVAISFSNA